MGFDRNQKAVELAKKELSASCIGSESIPGVRKIQYKSRKEREEKKERNIKNIGGEQYNQENL